MGIDNFFKSLAGSKLGSKVGVSQDGTNNQDVFFDNVCDSLPLETECQNSSDQVPKNLSVERNRVGCKRFYIDFNSILHDVANSIEKEVRYAQYAIIINKIDDRCRNFMKSIGLDYIFCAEQVSESSIETQMEYFKTVITSTITDSYIMEKIKDQIDYLMSELVTGEMVERLYISMDGMPTMAKIVEQRKRRMMTSILGGLRRKIHSKLKTHLSKDRLMYETYMYTFDRSKFAPINEFMDALLLYLTDTSDTSFQSCMKNRYRSIKNIVVSSHHLPGEGEKKIMEDIISNNYNDGECIIFSPDSDVVILSVLIRNVLNRRATLDMDVIHSTGHKNKMSKGYKIMSPKTKNVSKVGMIRFNTYENSYEYISADDLCHEIFSYVQNRSNLELDEDRVTNDISFIFTLLGNDFLPRLEAINIKTDIMIILNVYAQMLEITHRSRHFGMYIVYHNRYSYRINYASFSKYIELLSYIEVGLMKEKYISSTYRNYKRFKHIFNECNDDQGTLIDDKFNTDLVYTQLMNYLQFANVVFSTKKIYDTKQRFDKFKKQSGFNKTPLKSDIITYVQNELVKLFGRLSDTQFGILLNTLANVFLKVERVKVNNANWSNLNTLDKLTRIVEGVLNDTYSSPSLELRYNDQDVKSPYHQENIRSQFPHPDMTVTVYDEEFYMITRCIGRYKDALEPEYEIGSFGISVHNGKYKYESSYIVNDSVEYYKRYFGIDLDFGQTGDNVGSEHTQLEKCRTTEMKKLDTVAREYISGLFWVFNYYVNFNDVESNRNTVSTWFYRYSHAPLLFHISKYIHYMSRMFADRKERWGWMESIFESVGEKSHIPRKAFMNPVEYYIYVTPHYKLDEKILGKKLYSELMKIKPIQKTSTDVPSWGNINITNDVDDLVERLWDGDKTVIDTRNSYFSRGRLINLTALSYTEWRHGLKKNGVDLRVLDECCNTIINVDDDFPETFANVSSDEYIDDPDSLSEMDTVQDLKSHGSNTSDSFIEMQSDELSTDSSETEQISKLITVSENLNRDHAGTEYNLWSQNILFAGIQKAVEEMRNSHLMHVDDHTF